MKTRVLCLCIALMLAILEVPSASSAELCLGGKDILRSTTAVCESVADAKVVRRTDALRLFGSVSGDRNRLVFGRLQAPQGVIDLARSSAGAAHVRLKSASKEWPKGAELVVIDDSSRAEWHWQVDSDLARSLGSIALPDGNYEFVVSAPHFDTARTKIVARSREPVELGTVILRPSPFVAGNVIDRATRKPLPGAVITADTGKIVAVAGLNGDFREQLAPDINPAFLNVSMPGYGTRTILLSGGRSDRKFPDIELSAAGRLRVRVGRDSTRYPTLSVEILRIENRKPIHLKSGRLPASVSEWVADELDSGDVTVLVTGDKPFEKIGKKATVKSGETTTVDVDIRPIDLLGSVTRGSVAVAGAQVDLKSSQSGWTSSVKTSDDGTFEQDLWQAGRFAIVVSGADLREPYLTAEEIADAPTAHLNVKIPAGRIAGRVVDARSQNPVAAAQLTLDSNLSDDTQRSFGATADEQGRFSFEGVGRGRHTITAEASNYHPSAPQIFDFTSDDESKQIEVKLNAADLFPLIVTTPEGVPVAGASVLQSTNLYTEAPATDARGRVDVPVDATQGALLLVAPKSGSFALYRIAPATAIPNDPARMVVKPASASVTIKALEDSGGGPVQNAHLLVRYNGEFIEPALARLFGSVRGLSFTTDQRGEFVWPDVPAGLYEFWPYGSAAQAAEIRNGGKHASVTLPVNGGPYAVTIRLDTRTRP